jgi:hypothetical protein
LGERLIAAGKLSERDLHNALQAQQELGGLLGQVLVQLGVVAEADVAQILAEQLGVPWLRTDDFPDLLPEVPGLQPGFLEAQCVCPIAVQEGVLQVAMAVPQDSFITKALRLATGLQIAPALALEADIRKALADAQEEQATDDADENGWSGSASGGDFVEHLKDLASEAPVIRLVSSIIARAKGRELDLRVSTTPTVYGESIVMRVLDRANVRLSLDTMGFAADTLQRFNELLTRPHGIVLVTGPTGSGKTTTLYAALSAVLKSHGDENSSFR